MGESVKPIAHRAFDGDGEFNPGEATCRFCRANGVCREQARYNLQLGKYENALPSTLNNREVAEILPQLDALEKWAKAVREYALSECVAGREVPGYKVVEGRRTRAFTNMDQAFDHLIESGLDKNLLYERKPITLTAVEELLGKAAFKEKLGEFITRSPGKPTLVKENDKRPPIQSPSAQDDFIQYQEQSA